MLFRSVPLPAVSAAAGSRRGVPTHTLSLEAQKRREEAIARREEARKEREEARKKQREELAKMTPEERDQRMHDINVEIIISNQGPPLPIELNERDLKKLAEAGFDVPGVDAGDAPVAVETHKEVPAGEKPAPATEAK